MSMRLSGSLAMSGSITATGQIIAQTLNVQQVTSSIVYSSGSNIFGNSLVNTQIMTGSVSITGSLSVNGSPVVLTNQTASTTFVQGGNSFGTQALIGTNDNQNLALETSGSIRMFISSSGNVGVGTASPAYRLDVVASTTTDAIRVQQGGSSKVLLTGDGVVAWGASANAGVLTWDTGFARVNAESTNDLRLTTSGGGMLIVKSGGNVGIGTTSPGNRLDVVGSISYSGVLTSGGLGGRLWVPGQAIGQASNAGLYGLALTYLAKYEGGGWKSVGGGYASAITVDEGIFSFSNSQGVGAPDTSLTWTTRLMINESGNVGIGTTSPSGKLDISSGLRTGTISGLFIGADSDTSTGTRTNDTRKLGLIASPHYSNATRPVFGIAMDNQVSNNFIHIGGTYSGYNAATAITFSTGLTTTTETGTERMRITSDGSIGIGTTSPNTRLTINNGGASTSTNYQFKNISIISGFIGGYTSSAIHSLIAGYDSTTYYGTDIGYFYDTVGYGLTFSTNPSLNGNPPTERMRITSGGNVGIGTTNPAAELQVGKSSDVTFALSNSSSVTSGTRGNIAWYNSSVSTVANIRATAVTDNVGTELQFYTRPAAGSLTQVLTLASTGASTFSSSVTATQFVANGASTVPNLILNGPSTTWTRYQTSGTDRWDIGNNVGGLSSNQFSFYSNGASSNVFVIQQNGNVGIGTTSPFGKLSVDVTAAAPSPSGNMANGLTVHNTSFGRAIQLGVNESGAYTYIQSSYVNNADVGVNLAFFTGANERMRITSGGDLLLGTTTSDAGRLQIQASGTGSSFGHSLLMLDSSIYKNALIISHRNGETRLMTTYGGSGINCDMTFWTTISNGNQSERMRITAGGNVGIGTTSPAGELHIVNASGTGQPVLELQQQNAGSNILQWRGSAGSYLGVISNDGNVGIGTTSPSTILDVRGSGEGIYVARIAGSVDFGPHVRMQKARGSVSSPTIVSNGDTLGSLTFEAYNGSIFSEATGIRGIVNGTVSAGSVPTDLIFAAGASGTTGANERMRITSGGFVGIGTTGPAERLTVAGGNFRLNGANSNSRLIIYQNYSNSAVGVQLFNTSGTSVIDLNGNAGNIDITGTITLNSRTVYGTAVLYDNAANGNNVGIGFGPNSVLPVDGGGSASNGTKDLGSDSFRWRTVFTSDLDMSNGIGDYTIVEGEEDLFLYNNKTNKVFKFLIQEVDPSTAPPKKVK